MAHKRKTIRDAAVTLLTGLTTTGANVFGSRALPLKKAALPALCVYTPDEAREQEENGRRHLTLSIEGRIKSSAGDVDDTADAIAEEIEAAIDGDPTFGGLAIYTGLLTTEVEFDAEAEKTAGLLKMQYLIIYTP